MENYKWTDMHFPLSVFNAGMFAISALEGDPDMMAFNGGLFALNAGLATSGRKGEIRDGAGEVREKALEKIYDSTMKERVAKTSSETEVEYGRRTSGRRIC